MSAARKLSEQFQETFAAMPLSSRITTGLLVILVLIGLGFVAKGNPREESEMLFGGRSLSEQELDSVEMSFSQAGLNGWRREGRRISVPTESRSEYLSALSKASSLPVSIRSSVQDAIEKTTFLESSSQRLAREMHAKEQDLGNKLAAFPEIRWASVEYDLGERAGLGGNRQQTASVVVCPEGGLALSTGRIEDIKEFIRGSYAGMSSDDVVVIDTHVTELDDQPTDEAVAEGQPQTPQSIEKQRLEQQIGELLKDYGPVRVTAYVELSPHGLDENRSDQAVVPQPVIQHDLQMTKNDAITHVRSSRATRLHKPVASSPVGSGPVGSGPVGSSPVGSGSETQIRTQQPAITIPPTGSKFASACVSIGLPQSYYQRLWDHLSKQQSGQSSQLVPPPPTSAQLDQLRQQTQGNIRTAVTPALLSVAPFQSQQSMVQIYDFPDLLTTDVTAKDTFSIATTWLGVHWQQVALLVVCFFGLSLALRLLGKAPSTSPVTRPLASQVSPQSRPEDTDSVLSHQSPRTDASTDRELLALIEQDPDAAVDVIRGWIGEAA